MVSKELEKRYRATYGDAAFERQYANEEKESDQEKVTFLEKIITFIPTSMTPLFKKGVIGIVAFILTLIIISIQPFTYENIDAGNVGIKINLYGSDRGVDNITIVTGRVWYNTWTTKIIEFPTFVQQADYNAFVVTTKDGAEFVIDPKLNYKITDAMVPKIYRKYRRPLGEIQQGFMLTTVQDAYRIIANGFSSDSVISNREGFENRVQTKLSETLTKDGFEFEQLTSNIKPPQSLSDMIEAKNRSIQAKLTAENQTAEAKAQAEVTIAEANGEATAMLIKARAESEGNRLKQQALTPLLIQQQWISKWNGSLPTTQMGGNTPVIMNLK